MDDTTRQVLELLLQLLGGWALYTLWRRDRKAADDAPLLPIEPRELLVVVALAILAATYIGAVGGGGSLAVGP